MQTTKRKFVRALGSILLALSINSGIAQPTESPDQQLQVHFEVVPHTQTFMANITPVDTPSLGFHVWFANPQKEKVRVSISSPAGYLYSKKFTDAWYAQNYDFSGLEDGTYTIEIEKGKDRFKRNILISTDTYTVRRKEFY